MLYSTYKIHFTKEITFEKENRNLHSGHCLRCISAGCLRFIKRFQFLKCFVYCFWQYQRDGNSNTDACGRSNIDSGRRSHRRTVRIRSLRQPRTIEIIWICRRRQYAIS